MKIHIYNETLTAINNLKNEKLLTDGVIFIIKDFTVVTETVEPKKTFFSRNPKPIEKHYVTDMELISYNPDLKFVGTYNEEFICTFLTLYDLIKLRHSWVAFEEQLNAINKHLEEETKKSKNK